MKATLIDKRSFALVSNNDATIIVKMDLYKIHGKDALNYPDGYRFSWIAFKADDPKQRVLFDSHPPKGPHFHINTDPVGSSFVWATLEKTEQLFFDLVAKHFDIDREVLT